MSEKERRKELADFLRTRRARLSPQQVGLPPGSRRRVAGLQREEVALTGRHQRDVVHMARTSTPSKCVAASVGADCSSTPT